MRFAKVSLLGLVCATSLFATPAISFDANQIFREEMGRTIELSRSIAKDGFRKNRSIRFSPDDPVIGRRGSRNKLFAILEIDCSYCSPFMAELLVRYKDADVEIRPLFMPRITIEAEMITLYECAARRKPDLAEAGIPLLFALKSRETKDFNALLSRIGMSRDEMIACVSDEARFRQVVGRMQMLLGACGAIECVVDAIDPNNKQAMLPTPHWIFDIQSGSATETQVRVSGAGLNSMSKLQKVLVAAQ